MIRLLKSTEKTYSRNMVVWNIFTHTLAQRWGSWQDYSLSQDWWHNYLAADLLCPEKFEVAVKQLCGFTEDINKHNIPTLELLSTWSPAGTQCFWPRASLWDCDITRDAGCRRSTPARTSHVKQGHVRRQPVTLTWPSSCPLSATSRACPKCPWACLSPVTSCHFSKQADIRASSYYEVYQVNVHTICIFDINYLFPHIVIGWYWHNYPFRDDFAWFSWLLRVFRRCTPPCSSEMIIKTDPRIRQSYHKKTAKVFYFDSVYCILTENWQNNWQIVQCWLTSEISRPLLYLFEQSRITVADIHTISCFISSLHNDEEASYFVPMYLLQKHTAG